MRKIARSIFLVVGLIVLVGLAWLVLSPADDGIMFPSMMGAEALAQANTLKSQVQSTYERTFTCPRNGQAGIARPEAYWGEFVVRMSVQPMPGGCEIVATLRGPEDAVWKRLDATPAGHSVRLQLSGQPMAWRCVGDMPARFLPKACSSSLQ
jgi:hypothetical protein